MTWYKGQLPKTVPIANTAHVSSLTPKIGTTTLHNASVVPKPVAIHRG